MQNKKLTHTDIAIKNMKIKISEHNRLIDALMSEIKGIQMAIDILDRTPVPKPAGRFVKDAP